VTSHVTVPWARPYFGSEERARLLEVFESGWLSQGRVVRELEERVEKLTSSAYCLAVNSGTAALDIALKLFGVRPGDEIVVPAFSYIASATCVLYQGATPVFADVDPVTYTLDPADVRRVITPRTRGIVAVDYAGQAPPWDELRAIASERGLFVVEDAAPSLGGRYRGRSLGTLGDVGITSFHVAKTFSAVEGGMVFTEREDLCRTAAMIRSQGESPTEKYWHPVLGHNYRMSDLHAAVGLAQLERYEEVLRSRADAAARYTAQFRGMADVRVPEVAPDNEHAWFLYPVLVPNRDAVRRELRERGIETNVSWPRPIYDQLPFAPFRQRTCPVSERICREVLCLPLYYGMTADEQELVVKALGEAVERCR